jgi:hypothetical protein
VRALPAAVALAGQARARKHDRDLGNRLAGQAAGLLGRDAVLTVTGPRNAGKVPDCGTPAREQVTGRGGDAGIGTVILIRDHEHVCEDRGARRAREDPPGRPARSRLIATRRCTTKGSGPAWTPGPGSAALPDRRHHAGIRGARGRVMARSAAGDGVVAAGGWRGEEDEQA